MSYAVCVLNEFENYLRAIVRVRGSQKYIVYNIFGNNNNNHNNNINELKWL